MDIGMSEFAGTLSAFAYDKKVLKNYTFIIVSFDKQVRVNVFYKSDFSLSFLSNKNKLQDILIDIGLGDREVNSIMKVVECIYLEKFMVEE